jgi:DNA-binding protein HU-beta
MVPSAETSGLKPKTSNLDIMGGVAMKKSDLAETIMTAAGITKANVNRFYHGLVDAIKKEIVGKSECVLPGLGVFRARMRKARDGRNPRTGAVIHIPRRKGVSFRPYKELRLLLNPGSKEKPQEGKAPEGEKFQM